MNVPDVQLDVDTAPAFSTELILHCLGVHLTSLPVVPAVGRLPSLLHLRVPLSVNPVSHVGTHDAPALTVLVQVPTAPSLGAVEKSQVLTMHFGCTIFPSTHLPVFGSPPGFWLQLVPAQAPLLQTKLHFLPPPKEPVVAHAGDEPPTESAVNEAAVMVQSFSHLAALQVPAVHTAFFDAVYPLLHCGTILVVEIAVPAYPENEPVIEPGLPLAIPVMSVASDMVSAALRSEPWQAFAAQVVADVDSDPAETPDVTCLHVCCLLVAVYPVAHFMLQLPASWFVVLQVSARTWLLLVMRALIKLPQLILLHTPGVSTPFLHDDAVHL